MNILDLYYYYYNKRDERVITWPLLRRPQDMFVLLLGYFILLYIGPRYMKNQRPFELKYPLIIHSSICLLISIYMVIETAHQLYINQFSLFCNTVDYTEKGLGMAKVIWLFYCSKIIELLDTVFMVLRKKENQITPLHIYHHSSMVILSYIGVSYMGGGDGYFVVLANSLVHTVMYIYYTLSLFGYNIWWKKYLTQLQLIQFFMGITFSVAALYYDCNIPKWIHWTSIAYMLSFIILFGLFYQRTYTIKKKTN